MNRSKTSRILDEAEWAANFAAHLVEMHKSGVGASVTWYNHASVQRAAKAALNVAGFDYIGVDGVFLRWMLAPTLPRTSADLVLPLLLSSFRHGGRVALVGSVRVNLEAATRIVESLPSSLTVVYTCDGYDELRSATELAKSVRDAQADVVIIGLGAPLQDSYALALAEAGLSSQLVLTCGGWLDQVGNPGYYPAFAYRLKLNWFFRLAREPRRLWRRYTVEAVQAFRNRRAVRSFLAGARGVTAMTRACASAPVPE